jgi:hypothetical protein
MKAKQKRLSYFTCACLLLLSLLFWLLKRSDLSPAAETSSNPEVIGSEKTVVQPNSPKRSSSARDSSETVAATSSPAMQNYDRDQPELWKVSTSPTKAALVANAAEVAQPEAEVVIDGKNYAPKMFSNQFERLKMQPEAAAKVTIAWPSEHRAQAVAVQAVQGGLINGEIGAFLPIKNGAISFTYTAPLNQGHDEIVFQSANLEFSLPLWVATPDSSIPAPSTLNR